MVNYMYHCDSTHIQDDIYRSWTSLVLCLWNKRRFRGQADADDELTKYSNIVNSPDSQNPLDWWVPHQDDYPVLKHLAFTLLAAPASTSADERLFSIAGKVVNEQRSYNKQDLAENVQCFRSWYTGGLI
jgi:hypothetical protein